MIKRSILLIAIATIFIFQTFVSGAIAVELDAETRTVPLNEKGDTVVLSLEQIAKGKELFNSACAKCHVGGGTRTNPNINLSPESLALAFPPRNNLKSLVDYIKEPTTYDGVTDISEVHPATKSADVFPEMRNLSDEDLKAIAGHILLQPKINPTRWAGGKAFY
ncbi:MAG: photosystem II cytochrome c-550 [Synechococcales bacterium]|nr:photosystem II cytochrome c-550 [Synechococcales bacterium]